MYPDDGVGAAGLVLLLLAILGITLVAFLTRI